MIYHGRYIDRKYYSGIQAHDEAAANRHSMVNAQFMQLTAAKNKIARAEELVAFHGHPNKICGCHSRWRAIKEQYINYASLKRTEVGEQAI